MVRTVTNALALLALIISNICMAADPGKGAVIVRIPDSVNERCINSSTDRVWLRLRRIITSKDTGLLSKDSSAGIVIRTTIEGDTGGTTQSATFPRMKEVTSEGYAQGQGVSLPLEFNLLNGLILTQGSNKFTNASFDFSIMKKKKKTAWASGLSALANVTKNLPLPANPFTEGFKFFTSYADDVVNEELKNKNNAMRVAEGEISLNFSPNGSCAGGDFEKTGTFAVIQAPKEKNVAGYIDISKTNEVCWQAEFTPAFVLKYASKNPDGKCAATFQTLRNNYYGFVLMAMGPSTPSSAVDGGVPSVADGGSQEAIADALLKARTLGAGHVEKAVPGSFRDVFERCAAHGLSPEDCLELKEK